MDSDRFELNAKPVLQYLISEKPNETAGEWIPPVRGERDAEPSLFVTSDAAAAISAPATPSAIRFYPEPYRMNRHRPIAVVALLALILVASPRLSAAEVKLTQQDGKILVEIGGKPFTEYRFQREKDLPWARPYFYPVRAPDGVEISSDQSRTNPKEHPHHRSLWVSQGAVNGVDHWAHPNKPATPDVKPADVRQPEQKHLKFETVAGDTIVEHLAWEDKEGKPMLLETRTWKFFAFPDGAYGIDQTSVFTAPEIPVTFGETKEAGLASVRLNKAISDTSVITQEKVTSKDKKTENTVWGKKSPWCDLSGKIDGKDYGAAILDHPSNPRHPSNWHVRHYGLLSANVFGLHDFDKTANAKGSGDFKIEPGKPVTFKYRYVIHTGDAAAAKLPEKFAEFAK